MAVSTIRCLAKAIFLAYQMGWWGSLLPGLGQQQVTGRVTDITNNEPLSLVNITWKGTDRGTLSQVDGSFTVDILPGTDTLIFSSVGYYSDSFPIDFFQAGNYISVALYPMVYTLPEAEVYPEENPAHRIIRLATANRRRNNWHNTFPCRYDEYEKIIFRMAHATEIASQTQQAPGQVTSGPMEEDILLIHENYARIWQNHPGASRKNILATRASGFRYPSFLLAIGQLHELSVTDNFITLGDRQYTSPIANGALSIYNYRMLDTLFSDRGDTTYIISFHPRYGVTIDALKGVIYINTRHWAVQQLNAETVRNLPGMVQTTVYFASSLVHDTIWFPIHTRASYRLSGMTGEAEREVRAEVSRYISDVVIDEKLSVTIGGAAVIHTAPLAHLMPPAYWQSKRHTPLTEAEKQAYHRIDSIGREQRLEESINLMEALLAGYIPGRFFDARVSSLLAYNSHEGLRPGLGVNTSKSLSKVFRLSGHVGYGVKDRTLKYGGHAGVTISRKHDFWVELSYLNDLRPSGGLQFLEAPGIFSASAYSTLYTLWFERVEEWQSRIGFMPYRYWHAALQFSTGPVTTLNGYRYDIMGNHPMLFLDHFRFTEATLALRWAYKEKILRTPMGNSFSFSSVSPEFLFNLRQGLSLLGGNYGYTRIEAKINSLLNMGRVGESRLQLVAGYVTGNVPLPKLFSGSGLDRSPGFGLFGVFATMGPNEFLSDRFIHLFLRHRLGKMLLGRIDLTLAHNAAIGSLMPPPRHEGIQAFSAEKVFMESGILLGNIFRAKILGYGLGVYYRHGPYTYSRQIDNFAPVFTLHLNL